MSRQSGPNKGGEKPNFPGTLSVENALEYFLQELEERREASDHNLTDSEQSVINPEADVIDIRQHQDQTEPDQQTDQT